MRYLVAYSFVAWKESAPPSRWLLQSDPVAMVLVALVSSEHFPCVAHDLAVGYSLRLETPIGPKCMLFIWYLSFVLAHI